MEVHHHPIAIGSHTASKKMDTLFLGIFNVVPCCLLWFYIALRRRMGELKIRAKDIREFIIKVYHL